jgi:ribosomal protein S18 acetylase RimI-like enzyme
MSIDRCTNKAELHEFLVKEASTHIYAIGDLDDFFWVDSSFYVHRDEGTITAMVLVYQPTELPILVALGSNVTGLRSILEGLISTLPNRVYCHLVSGTEDVFNDHYKRTYFETQHRMILTEPTLKPVDRGNVIRFASQDSNRLNDFFEQSYPSNWFDDRMLESGHFFGYVHNHQLVSVAGLHAYSFEYKVAALGNITTHPDFRGQGFAQICTSAVCHSLKPDIELIGLNVNGMNAAAIHCYKSLGFRKVLAFSELMLERR